MTYNCPKCHCGCLFEDHGRLVCLNCGAETTKGVARQVRHTHHYQTYTGRKAGTAEQLASMMSYNVAAHYGGESNFPGLKLCAKTGTAELGDGTSHAWFAGFLQDEEHPYAFVVMIEQGGGGLSAAGSLANTLLQAAVNR